MLCQKRTDSSRDKLYISVHFKHYNTLYHVSLQQLSSTKWELDSEGGRHSTCPWVLTCLASMPRDLGIPLQCGFQQKGFKLGYHLSPTAPSFLSIKLRREMLRGQMLMACQTLLLETDGSAKAMIKRKKKNFLMLSNFENYFIPPN